VITDKGLAREILIPDLVADWLAVFTKTRLPSFPWRTNQGCCTILMYMILGGWAGSPRYGQGCFGDASDYLEILYLAVVSIKPSVLALISRLVIPRITARESPHLSV